MSLLALDFCPIEMVEADYRGRVEADPADWIRKFALELLEKRLNSRGEA